MIYARINDKRQQQSIPHVPHPFWDIILYLVPPPELPEPPRLVPRSPQHTIHSEEIHRESMLLQRDFAKELANGRTFYRGAWVKEKGGKIEEG